MNYSGKFDAKLSDALGQHPGAHLFSETVHASHVPSDAIVVPDAQLLFGAEFKRTGVDLVLSGDGREFVVHDYFKGEKHAPLASADGAHLTGDIVTALAGQVQIAQAAAGNAGAGQVIGHVTKLVGTATAIRNGVSIILNSGDNVEKGDVVQSGSESTLGITFIDGTVFGLSSNARMVLNEMVYDPNGSNNSSLLSLVAGTITFVAGETAKHGDMKIDTPVATMGIRGTAVLVEIDFSVPGATPDAKFQVLVEPDGTTGSYILFDKTTLTPLAVVDRAGMQINISNGLMSQTTSPLSPEIQKLITDVFSLKFSDSTNTKSLDHFTDSIIPTPFGTIKFSVVNTTLPTFTVASASGPTSGPAPASGANVSHIAQAPNFTGISDGKVTELASTTGSATPDKVTGIFQYFDVNVNDHPTVSVAFASFDYKDANGNDVTKALNALELADIKAVKDGITVTQGGLDSVGNGTASWTYKIPDGAFDFLAAGEKLTLTFNATVDNNYVPADQIGSGTFTVTITGTNDVPVITSPQQNITFAPAGTETSGGTLNTATHGTLAFADPDLSDTHTVGVQMTSALLNGHDLSEIVGTDRYNAFAAALTAKITTADDSTGTGTGQVEWTLADLEVYLADLVPTGESLVLTYTVTVTDSQGATSQQNIVVTIGGNKPAATAWIDTSPIPEGGVALWSTAANWESDKAPTSADDVFIGNDQVNPKTATFPVTVDANGAAKSLSMNGFSDGNGIPTLNVKAGVTLAISGALNLNTSPATDPLTGDPLILPTAEAIINNYGTITVGGIAELLKSSVLNNHGTLVLSQGGAFVDQTSVTNAGTIELAGSTLDLAVDIHNSAGNLLIDKGTALKISDGVIINPDGSTSTVGTTISSGKVTIAGGATLDIESGKGVTLDGVEVDGTNAASPVAASVIEVGVSTAALLVLDDGTSIKDGVLKILGGSTLDVESVGGATLNDVSVIGVSGGTPSTIGIGDGATLVLENSTIVTNGDMTIADTAILEISGNNGGTLSDVVVENSGTIQVDSASPAPTLVLEGGTTITDGKMQVDGVVEIGTGGATLDNVIVANSSIIQVDGPGSPTPTTVTLVLDGGTKITGGTLLIHDKSSTDEGVVEIGTGGAVLDDVTVTNNNLLTVDPSVTLTLDDGTTVAGGQLTLNAGSTLDIEAGTTRPGATLDGVFVDGADAAAPALASTIEVGISGAATLLLDDDTTIIDGNLTIAGGSTLDIEAGTIGSGAALDGVTVNGTNAASPALASTIEVGISGAATLLLDDDTTIIDGNLTIAGASTLDIEAGATGRGATLDGVNVTGTSAVDPTLASTIEIGLAGAATLLLDDGTTIADGNVTIAGGSTLDIEAGTRGPGATLDGVTVNGTSSADPALASTIEIGAAGAATLLLENSTVVTDGDLTIDSGSTLQIETSQGAALDGVTVTNHGTIQVDVGTVSSTIVTLKLEGGTTITGGELLIHKPGSAEQAVVEIGSGGAVLDRVTVADNGTLKVGSSATLTLKDGTTITGGTVTVEAGGNLDVDATGATLDKVTLSGSVTNAGTLTIEETVTLDSATIGGVAGNIIDDTGTLAVTAASEIDNATINGGGTLDATVAALTLSEVTLDKVTLKGSFTNSDTLTIEETVTLDGATIGGVAGNIIDDTGTLSVTAASEIDNATIDGGGTLDATVAALTLSEVTLDKVTLKGSFTNSDTLAIDETVTLDGVTIGGVAGNIIDDTGTLAVTAASEIDNATIDGGGTLDATVAALTLSEVTLDKVTLKGSFTNSDTLTIKETVTLDGVTIGGVAGNIIDDTGTLAVTAASEIDNATINGGGTLDATVAALTLSEVTLDKVTLKGSFTNSDTLTIEETVTLDGATIGGVAGNIIDDTGTLSVTAASEIDNATIDGGGTLDATVAALTLSEVTLDKVTLKGSFTNSDKLTIDETVTLDGASISGGTIDDKGTLSGHGSIGSVITDTGAVTADDGTLTLSGLNTYSGATTINSGAVLAAGVAGAFSANSAVTDNGELDLGTTNQTIAALNGTNTAALVGSFSGTGTGPAVLTIGNGGSFAGAIEDGTAGAATALTLTAGTLTLTGDNTFTGVTTINGGTLALSGSGSISDSSDVIDNGTFDISKTSGASIVTLSGTGTVDLDTETLTLSHASTTFGGAIGGGGGLTLTAGTETLSGDNLYTGVTTINGGTLKLSGSGSISDSSDVIDNGTFDISGTSGASIVTLSGAGTVDLGAENLTLTDATTSFSGNFIGTGSVIVAGGTLTFGTATLNNATLVGNYAITGTLTIDGTSKLSGASITGGAIDVEGELDTTGSNSITGSSITNKGHIHTLGGTLTIDPTPFLNLGLFEVQSAVTMIDETVVNSQTVGKVTTSGTVQVDNGYTLTLDSSAINGGIVSNSGTIHVVAGSPTSTGSSINNTFSFGNSGIINADGVALTLNGVTVNNAGGKIETTGTNGLLNLVKSTINLGTLAGKITTAAGNTTSTLNGGFGPSSGLTLAIGSLVTATVGVLELTGNIFNYGEIDSVKGTGVSIDLDNTYLTGGTLGGSGLITTGPSNAFGSVLDGVTIASGTKVLASSSTLELTDTITNGGEIDAATHGWLELDNATIVGGTIGGSGSVFTVSNFNELKGVAIANGTTVDVSDGTTLELAGTITDAGTISLDGFFHGTGLEISGNVSLAGGGNVVMSDSSHNFIGSDGHGATLTNFDTISGAGTIGDSHLSLVNDGTIDATGWNPLIIDTGANSSHTSAGVVGDLPVMNNGTLEASAGSTLLVEDNVANNGVIKADASNSPFTAAHVQIDGNVSGSGSIEIFKNGQVEIGGTVSEGQTVTFEQSNGSGLLILDDSHGFKGTIAGLTEAPIESQENHVDLLDLAYSSRHMSVSYSDGEVTIANHSNHDSVTLKVSGNSSGSFEISSDGHGGTMLDDPAATGNVTIDSDQLLGISAASSATVSFANSTATTGELLLTDSKDFTGHIAGFAGDGTIANSDLIDVADLNFADVATGKTTYTDHGDGTGTLTLYNAQGQALDNLDFDGNYQLANFTVENDGDGHTLIVDPPVNTSGQTPANTTVASNQNSNGTAATDGFVFNFDKFDHHQPDSHPGQDTFQPGGQTQTGPNEVPDPGHSNLPQGGDGHDHFVLNASVKAQLHAHDFHFV